MQWLIDLIKDWVIAQNYLTTGFVDRGDPAAADFGHLNFTKDGTWRDLDLSGIVPAGAKAASITVSMQSNQVAAAFYLRKKGNVNAFNVAVGYTQVGFDPKGLDLVVPLDTDRKCQYNISVATWHFIDVTVKGWWL